MFVTDLNRWEGTKATHFKIINRVEALCLELSERWPRRTADSEREVTKLLIDPAVVELQQLLPSLPGEIRPSSNNPNLVLAWAVLMAGRLGQRSL